MRISEQDIAVENLPEGYRAEVTTYEEEFSVQIRGLAADVNAVDASQIRPVVDIEKLIETGALEEVEEGYYDVKLSLELPEGVEMRDSVTVRLNIEKTDTE